MCLFGGGGFLKILEIAFCSLFIIPDILLRGGQFGQVFPYWYIFCKSVFSLGLGFKNGGEVYRYG